MAREGEPRLSVRFSNIAFARVSAAAAAADVAVAGLVRECAVRHAVEIARQVSEGHVKVRRRSLVVPVLPAAASFSPEDETGFAPGGKL